MNLALPRTRRSAQLPDFPWDTLAPAKVKAQAHPDGIVDLSVGTPVDPTPDIARQALADAGNSPGYPLTSGTADLREAIVGYLARRWGAQDLTAAATLPVIGTKELVAWLPTLLGLGPDDLVVYPAVAYPTYAVGATLAGCSAAACDDLEQLGQHAGVPGEETCAVARQVGALGKRVHREDAFVATCVHARVQH